MASRPHAVALCLAVVVAAAAAGEARAQATPPAPAEPRPAFEWSLLGAGGAAFEIFNSASDRNLAHAALTLGWTVTDLEGEGFMRGRLSLLVEIVPAFVMFQPDRAFGAGVTPIFLRWTFATQPVQPFVEISGGAIRTDRPVPEMTARFNFTAHAGAGLRVPLTRARTLLLGYRFHHISNGYRLPENPSVNSNVFYAGIAFRR